MSTNNSSLQKSALTAGVSLLIMTILSIATLFSLNATALSIISIAIIIILDVIVAIALYRLFKFVNLNLSFLTALFRVVYAIVFTIALIKMPDIGAFTYTWERGLLVFGFHLLLLGILIYQSKFVPKWIGILVVLAGLGYIIDSLGKFWSFSLQFGMFTFIGELIFMVWLIFWGRKIHLD
jgi:hypothetical protein